MILDKSRLELATHAVIDALSEFEPEYKIAALHFLIDSFPEEYTLISKEDGVAE